jgi:hypothetical protein
VGFASQDEIKAAFKGQLFDNKEELAAILTSCSTLASEFQHFQEVQLLEGADGYSCKRIKAGIQKQLGDLRAKLNGYMALVYGINEQTEKRRYAEWLATHQPFHRFAEFYQIIALNGGFDVVIGNPPYVEYAKVKGTYTIKDYKTEDCGNLYAYVMERAKNLLSKSGYSGMIIPHSSICTDRMQPVMSEIFDKYNNYFVSSYDIRPSKLFDGVDQRLLIYIVHNNENVAKFVSNYHRWNSEYRQYLFSTLEYTHTIDHIVENSIIKIHCNIENDIVKKISSLSKMGVALIKSSKDLLYYHNAPRYYIRAMSFAPYFWNEKEGEKISTQLKSLYFENQVLRDVAITVFSSSLFYWWFVALSDCRHLNAREIEEFPIGLNGFEKSITDKLQTLAKPYEQDLKENAFRKECVYKATGKVIYDEFYPKFSKPIIDEIDRVLAKHYGFTEEELDFIINYDIKYRMGAELEDTNDQV